MIKIEPFHKTDFDGLISWVDSEETLVQFAGPIFAFPLTTQQLETCLEDEKRFAYKVVDLKRNSIIGHAEIYTPTDKLAILCRILIGDPRLRGLGLGQEIMKILLTISFAGFGVEKAELNVFDWNIGAIKCYEKVGFSINTEKKRTREVNGQTWTSLNMTIDKNNWEKLGKGR
jgi:RimJ/RimL family protein N-acetyltransferase